MAHALKESAASSELSIVAPAVRFSESRHGYTRPLERGDLERVADLFLSTFRRDGRGRDQQAIEDAAAYMESLYLEGPHSQSGINSLVQVDGRGDIGGFLGLMKTPYRFGDEELTACIIGALMAAEGPDHGMAGPQLLRSLKNAKGDLQLTDSANRTSLAFAQPMKYELLIVDSLEWVRVFKPAAMLVYKMRKKWPRQPIGMLSPVSRTADRLAGHILGNGGQRAAHARWHSESIDAASFVAIAPSFLSAFRLSPVWAASELTWLVERAAEKRANGPLNFGQVCDDAGHVVGCYAFYGQEGGVAHVLQILATKSRWGAVLDCLMETARGLGCIGVIGKAQEATMPHLFKYPGIFFYYAGGTMIRSQREDIVQAAQAKDLFVGGLAGDNWTRLSADEFGRH